MNSAMEITKRKGCEYILLVHFSIIKKLQQILKSISFIRLEDLCIKFRAKYQQELNYFITVHNELVFEIKEEYNSHSTIQDSIDEKMPQGWSGIEELVKKINFSGILQSNSRKVCDREVTVDEIKNYESVHFYCEFIDSGSTSNEQSLKVFNNYLRRTEIPNFFDKVTWKLNGIYMGTVSNIYDPSKFWMKFAEVDMLQNYLYKFYSEKKEEYILSLSDICIGLNCVVFFMNSYNRGKIVRTDIQDGNWFVIFLYDHGTICRLNRNNLFKLDEKFSVFPAFAVRCALTNVSPLDNESWTQQAMDRFSELTKDNKKLFVKVTHVKSKRKILEVYLMDSTIENEDKVPTINYQLVQEKLAKISWQEPLKSEENEVFKCLRKFTYLYPTHESIENATAPANLTLTNKLKECVCWDVLFPELYRYEN